MKWWVVRNSKGCGCSMFYKTIPAFTGRHYIIYRHVSGVLWLIITGYGLDNWIYCHIYLQSLLITINYKSSQAVTAYDSLHSLLDYKCLLFHCDWLGSDLRIGHFYEWQTKNQIWLLIYEWIGDDSLLNSLPTQSITCPPFITLGRTEHRTLPSTVHVIPCLSAAA
jgi:hypothetical protein